MPGKYFGKVLPRITVPLSSVAAAVSGYDYQIPLVERASMASNRRQHPLKGWDLYISIANIRAYVYCWLTVELPVMARAANRDTDACCALRF